MPLPDIPSEDFKGMPGPKPPEKPQQPPEESSKPEIHKPFEKTRYIPPQDFARGIRANSKVFHEIAGDSSSTFNELLNKINSKIDRGSSLTEQKIGNIQKSFKKEQLKAQQEGRSKDANIAGKAWDLLERFRKGEL